MVWHAGKLRGNARQQRILLVRNPRRHPPLARTARTDRALTKDLRIAEISAMDMQIAEGKIVAYRAKVKLSFRCHSEMHKEL